MLPIKDLTLPRLEEFVLALGEKKFRARQVFKWAYQKRLSSFDDMTNMPKCLRAKFAEVATLEKLETRVVLESAKGDAVKFGFGVGGCEGGGRWDGDGGGGAVGAGRGYVVESVLLLDDDRRTACLSSQIGCALGCTFCETGKLGFVRNLTMGEILGQLIGINDYLHSRGDRLVTNIVFMGMGEALSNFDNFMGALSVIMHEDAFNIGARRITVSTAGVVPSIERLMKEDLTIGLAISLNAWNDEMRSETMPINKTYPIKRLVEVAKKYLHKTGRRVTFEYIMIEGVTDTKEAAAALERLLGGFPCKVNLIPVNRVEARPVEAMGLGGRGTVGTAGTVGKAKAPTDRAVEAFAEELHRRGLAATVRKSRGQDIMGACGQLTARLLR